MFIKLANPFINIYPHNGNSLFQGRPCGLSATPVAVTEVILHLHPYYSYLFLMDTIIHVSYRQPWLPKIIGFRLIISTNTVHPCVWFKATRHLKPIVSRLSIWANNIPLVTQSDATWLLFPVITSVYTVCCGESQGPCIVTFPSCFSSSSLSNGRRPVHSPEGGGMMMTQESEREREREKGWGRGCVFPCPWHAVFKDTSLSDSFRILDVVGLQSCSSRSNLH